MEENEVNLRWELWYERNFLAMNDDEYQGWWQKQWGLIREDE